MNACKGKEVILFVDDSPALRKVAVKLLQRYGYHVFDASNGIDALELWKEHHTKVDLLATDMVMPGGITGLDLATKLATVKPDLKVLLMSGFSPELLGSSSIPTGKHFLGKPYSLVELLDAVQLALDR